MTHTDHLLSDGTELHVLSNADLEALDYKAMPRSRRHRDRD